MSRKYIENINRANEAIAKIFHLFALIFNKINQAINWTKKWHFFHIIAWIIIILVMGLLITYLLYAIIEVITHWGIPIINFQQDMEELESLCSFILMIFLGTFYWYFLIISILISLYKKWRNKAISVTNNFLLNNKTYHVFYILSLIYAIFLFALIFHFNNTTFYPNGV